MVYLVVGAVISIFYFLYVFFPMNEFRDGKEISGILFFILVTCVGAFLAQWCNSFGWKIAGAISVGQVVKIIQMMSLFLFGGLFLRGGVIRTILSVAICDVVGVLAELLERLLYFGLIHHNLNDFYIVALTEDSFLQGILLIGCCVLLCKFLNGFFKKIRTIPFEKRLMAKIVVCIYVAAAFSPIVKVMSIMGGDERDLFLLSICEGSLLLIFTALFLWERNKTYRQKNMYLFLQEQMIKEHVRLMEDQIMLTRRFRHDIRKHFDMVSYFLDKNPEYADSQQLSEYKRDLCGMYHSLSRGDYCDMMDVNAILYQLEQFCKKNRVSFAAKLKNMVCKDMKPEKRCDIFFGAVNWAMEICKDYEEKERLSVELSGETTAGRGIFAVTVKLKKSVDEIDSHSNLCVSSQSVWLERMEKNLTSCDGFWKTEEEPGMCRLVVSWAECIADGSLSLRKF